MLRYLRTAAAACCLLLPVMGIAQESPEGMSVTPETGKSMMLEALDIKDMDVNDCLKLFAAKTGLNIIAGKGITGRVTIFLQNVEVHDALTIILKSNDLAYIEERGLVRIMPEAEYEQVTGHKFGVETESAIIPLQSIKATDAMILLSQVKSVTGKIVADDQSNSIYVEDTPDHLQQLKDYVKKIDLPTLQKVYKLQYSVAEAVAGKVQTMLSPKIGSVNFDASSNKIFVRDTAEKMKSVDEFVNQIDVARETKVFQINYAKAEDLAKTITPLLSKDVSKIQADVRSNTVLVTDIAPKIDEVTAVIAALDKNDKEVLIEAKIVQIDLDDKYQMGVNWETLLPNANHALVDLKNNFSLPGSPSPLSVATIGTLDRDKYSVVLQMISSLGRSKLLSSPRIAVVNNQEAKILVGTTTPYVTDSTTTPASGPTTTAETVNFIDTGVKLHVTPTIHDDGYITIKIKPEVSNIPSSIVTSTNNQIPVVDTSEVETMVRVKDGVTIIIGGLIKDERKNTQSKIPVLGDLPLLGKAFRNEVRSLVKTEIVIFLTPHIISGDAHGPSKHPMDLPRTSQTYFDPLPENSSSVPVAK